MKQFSISKLVYLLFISALLISCSSDSTDDSGVPNDTNNQDNNNNDNNNNNDSQSNRLPQSIYDQESYTSSYIMDTDQDGDDDIIIGPANGPTADILLVNDGSGNFTVQQNAFPTRYQGTDGQTVNITSGDFNNDGLEDIIASTIDGREATFSESAEIHLYLNNGDNTFMDASSNIADNLFPTGWVEWIRVGDFNKDGHLDFVTTAPGGFGMDAQNGIFQGGYIYVNDGNANFARVTITMDDNADLGQYTHEVLAWDEFENGEALIGRYPLDIMAGDVDNDGDIDLVAPNGYAGGQWATFLNTSDGSTVSFDVVLNGDGNTDPYDEVLFKNGALLDINGDGFLDLVGSYSIAPLISNAPEEPIYAFLNDGSGRFTGPTAGLINGSPGFIHARQWLVADFDSDGIDDLFVSDHGIDVFNFTGYPNTLLMGNGSSLDDNSNNTGTVNGFTHGAAVGDIDNDGDLDLFLNNHQGLEGIQGATADFLIYLNNGNGVFTGER